MKVDSISSKEVRKLFLDFFEKKQHHIVPSAPLIIKNDPSLFFVNAGMNSFKEYFLDVRPSPYKRIANSQKCLRVSGKHNDLEEVGIDHYHHTMFEMLGNWSFGDYFRKEMIAWAWEFVTQVCQIEKDRLYVTIFEGSAEDHLKVDNEALTIWRNFIDENRIIFGGKKDNFWEMGETGPCGPCSEIHIDLRPKSEREHTPASTLINQDDPRVIEIWNIVFITYQRKKDKQLVPLKQKYIDTGMGLERLVRVMNYAESNYDTDLFAPIIKAIESLTEKQYEKTGQPKDIAFRVISDHIRAIVFAIADGQVLSNTGPGYVIRRILRRAVRYYHTHLAYPHPLLYQLVDTLADIMGEAFPGLKPTDYIKKNIFQEEQLFIQTLANGIKRLKTHIKKLPPSTKKITGGVAFELYDTYGFPLDLTALIAKEHNLYIDETIFQQELEKQKSRSQKATFSDKYDWIEWTPLATVPFVGYHMASCQTKISKYRRVTQGEKTHYEIVLSQTPFYGESGGQAGDTGVLTLDNTSVEIYNTKKENALIIHQSTSSPLAKWQGKEICATINQKKRNQHAVHHTATHLLHAALREVVGKHVSQKGSLVTQQKLRFDFTHSATLSFEDIKKIERRIFQKITENINVTIAITPKAEAEKLGAIALFEEKYGDEVRVITIDKEFSVELCGGTHVKNTGQIGFFKITHQSAIASGVRRVEAVAGPMAMEYLHNLDQKWKQLQSTLNHPKDIVVCIQQQQQELKTIKKAYSTLDTQLKHHKATTWKNKYALTLKGKNSVLWISTSMNLADASIKDIKAICNEITNLCDCICFFAIKEEEKVHLVFSASKTLVQIFPLRKLFDELILSIPQTNGGGGGNMYNAVCTNKTFSYKHVAQEIIKELENSNT